MQPGGHSGRGRWLEWLPRIDVEGASRGEHPAMIGGIGPAFADGGD